MLFCSQQFLVFFTIVFVLYWALPWPRGRVYLLLAASFYFYASWNHWLALIICASTTLDYFIARALEALSSPRARRGLLTVSIVANLGLLCYFKYANFFLHSLEQALRGAGVHASLPVLSVLVPIGISFYTFEAINYTVDVYRGQGRAERDLANFMLFILFFPHLVAGPIVRARDFLPQTRRRKRWSWPRAQLGVQLLLMGLFKKLAIADRMALFADPVFADPAVYGTAAVGMAVLAYALQLYCDFSGYTDMALGAAHLLGYRLAQNFNMPYLSANVSEFWRRWHISLSSWLRDYLFIPLGGSRDSTWRTNRNLMLTMALGGLWHGASWPCVVFGVIQGLYLVVHRSFRAWCQRRPGLDQLLLAPAGRAVRIAVTFLAFLLSLVIFRSATLGSGLTMLKRLVRVRPGLDAPLDPSGLWYTLAVVLACHALAWGGWWKKLAPRLPPSVLGFGYVATLFFALVLAPDAGKAFIYFQF
jgi:alginate O-acetyltransferase complex protein AlgI